MKKHIYLFIFFFGFSPFIFAFNFQLTGNLGNDTTELIILELYPENYAVPAIPMRTNAVNGQFKFMTSLKKIREARLRIGEMSIPMLIQPNDSLDFKLVQKGEKQIIVWSGNGAANNLFFLNYIIHSAQLSEDLLMSESFLSGDANLYRDLLNKDRLNRLDFIKKYRSEELGLPDRKTQNWVQNSMRYEMARALIEYPKLFKKIKIKGRKLKIPKDYYNFIGLVDFGKRELLDEQFYREFIVAWFNEYLIPKFKNKNDYQTRKELINLARRKMTPSDAELIQYQILRRALLSNYQILSYEKQVTDFLNMTQSENAKGNIQWLWDNRAHTFDDTLAPNFEFVNEKGDTIFLNDFRGKVLYIDMWATWCKPCLKNMPTLERFKSKFRDNANVVFLYISIDANRDKWLDWVQKNQSNDPRTVHVLAIKNEKQNIFEDWKIGGIPHNMIIDHNGIVAEYDAYPPQVSVAENQLRKWIKKSK